MFIGSRRSEYPGSFVSSTEGGVRAEPVRLDQLAQVGDVGLNTGAWSTRRILVPQIVDQAIGRHHLVCIDDEHTEQRPHHSRRQHRYLIAVTQRDITEHTDLHRPFRHG